MLSKVSRAIQYIVYDETGLSPEIRTCFAHECHTSKKILLLFVVVYNSRGREEEGEGEREIEREREGEREIEREREGEREIKRGREGGGGEREYVCICNLRHAIVCVIA